MAKAYLNKDTGEILEAECPWRTITDLKDYNDDEEYIEGTSVTSLEGYEPLESIVARCMRTIKSPNGTEYQVLDTEELKACETQTGVYDCAGAKDLDEAFACTDPTSAQGFDLADATNLGAEAMAKLSTSNNGAEPIDSSSDGSAVGNFDSSQSEAKSEDFPEKKSQLRAVSTITYLILMVLTDTIKQS